MDIILPAIMIQGGPEGASEQSNYANQDILLPTILVEEDSTRRIGYTYEPPLDEPRLNLPERTTSNPRKAAKTERPIKLTSSIDYKAPKVPLSNTLGAWRVLPWWYQKGSQNIG